MTDNEAGITDILTRGAEELGIALPSSACAAFETYYNLLEERNRHVNLTAITGEADVARLHFLDSICLLKAVNFNNAKVIDIGSGAGFPGIPLKLAEPTIDLTLLDATGKRVAFLADLCVALGIETTCANGRAEEYAGKPEMRERYDIAVSRAVAQLNILSELCLPFVRAGGVFLAMKGIDSEEEIQNADNAIKTLGAEVQSIIDYDVPQTDIKHRVVVIKKTAATPGIYPRKFAKIQKTPL